VQKVGLAAQLAGSDIEGVAKAMSFVTKNALDAAQKGGDMADSFKALGIDAGNFVNLPIEEKILALAQGMENGKGPGENLATVMKILGKSGAEMMPLISQGMEELKTQFEKTAVVSNSTVATLENLGDQWDSLKNEFTVGGSKIVEALFLIVRVIQASMGASVVQMGIAWDTLVAGFVNGSAVIGSAMKGDFTGAAAAFEKYKNGVKRGFEDTKNNAIAFGEVVKEVYDDIYNKPGSAPKKKAETVGPNDDAMKAEEERKKLAEDIVKMQEDARMRELSLAEQILEIEKKRAAIMAELNTTTDPVDNLEKQKQLLEIEKEIADLKEKQNKNISDASGEELKRIAAEQDKIAEAKTRDEQSQRDRKFEQADPAGKIKMLKAEQAQLLKDAREAAGGNDKATAIEKRTAAREKGYEIEDILKKARDAIAPPTIATGSLASIGAGGSANLLTSDTIQQRQLSVLETIAANTGRAQNGNQNIPEPV
jgi:hypothetical protein